MAQCLRPEADVIALAHSRSFGSEERLRPERGAKSPRESERGWAAYAKATASCAEAPRRRGPASTKERLRPERGAQAPRESERGWGPASIDK